MLFTTFENTGLPHIKGMRETYDYIVENLLEGAAGDRDVIADADEYLQEIVTQTVKIIELLEKNVVGVQDDVILAMFLHIAECAGYVEKIEKYASKNVMMLTCEFNKAGGGLGRLDLLEPLNTVSPEVRQVQLVALLDTINRMITDDRAMKGFSQGILDQLDNNGGALEEKVRQACLTLKKKDQLPF